MILVIIRLIMVGIIYASKKNDEKWYNNLSTEEKTKIKELEIRLSEINSIVKKTMPKKYSLYRELFKLSKNLMKDEEIMFFTKGNILNTIMVGNNLTTRIEKGYIFITNKKILITTKKLQKNIPLEKISSVDTGKTLMRHWIKINDNSTTIQLNDISCEDIEKIKDEINKGMEKHKNVSINITQTTEKDISDKIARLKVLYEEGVLTEYEFNMKKLELLDKIK